MTVKHHIKQLRELFPAAFTESSDAGGPRWKVDLAVLGEMLGDFAEDRPERFSFGWHGKSQARQAAQTPPHGTLRPCPDQSLHWAATRNLFLDGDNLEILKLLRQDYRERVGVIFIDPPYNTGNDLIYEDRYAESTAEYLRSSGQNEDAGSPAANPETSGRYHTNWLNMMYPRLLLARDLLSETGVLFVTIDDHEVCHLRFLLDEILGAENFVGCFLWKKMDSPSRNDATRIVSEYHDYVLTYSRNRSTRSMTQRPRPEILDAYPLTLPDGRRARRRQLRKNGKHARRSDRPSLWYPLTAPDGSRVWPVAPGPDPWEGRWVLSPETWAQRVAAGLTEWIRRDYGWVPYYIEVAPDSPSVPWSTWWDDLDQSRQSKAAFKRLMQGSGYDFDNPKPVGLIERLLRIAGDPTAIVLDFFAGSGTTGHAVMSRNAADGGTRQFILAQLPVAAGHGATVCDIARERLRRAAAEVAKQPAADRAAGPLDLGFRTFEFAEQPCEFAKQPGEA